MQDPSFRDCVIAQDKGCIDPIIRTYLPGKYEFSTSISNDPNYQKGGLPPKNIYIESVYIAGDPTHYANLIVKLYYWEKD